MTTYVPFESTVSYARNVSSESGYDWFNFYIDSEQKEHTSGTSNTWTMKSFTVGAGTHTFTFEYTKDQSVSSGSDCAWIDNVTIPGMGVMVEEDLPHIKVMDYTVEGRADGIVEGEAQITFDLKNIGNVNAAGIIAELSSEAPIDITAENPGAFSMNINEEKEVVFNLSYNAKSDIEYVELVLKITIEDEIICYYSIVLRCTGMPEPCEAPINLEGIAENHTALLTWEDSEEMEETLEGYNIYRDGIQINDELIKTKEYADKDLAVGTYHYYVTAQYEECGESSPTEEVIVTILSCEAPTELEGTAEQHTAILTWAEPENIDDELLGYNIYRDGEKINTTLITELGYNDEDLENGEYIYQVSAKYENCEELTEGITVTIDATNINKLANDVTIYPNPTSGTITITAASFVKVEIYNTVGQLVETKNVKTFDVSTYNTGIYFFKVYDTNNNSVTKRVMVTR
jgi:hypothetical protein